MYAGHYANKPKVDRLLCKANELARHACNYDRRGHAFLAAFLRAQAAEAASEAAKLAAEKKG